MLCMNYNEIRQLLKYRREELSVRLQKIREDFAQQDVIDDVLFAIAHETKLELANVKKALSQIDDNQFGQCHCCGAEISEQQLRQNPFQTLCDSCDNKEN